MSWDTYTLERVLLHLGEYLTIRMVVVDNQIDWMVEFNLLMVELTK